MSKVSSVLPIKAKLDGSIARRTRGGVPDGGIDGLDSINGGWFPKGHRS
jgi:hypothetical protein